MTERKPYATPKLEALDSKDPRARELLGSLLGNAVAMAFPSTLLEASTNVRSIACAGCFASLESGGGLSLGAVAAVAAAHVKCGKGLRLVVVDEESNGQPEAIPIPADALERVGPLTAGFLQGVSMRSLGFLSVLGQLAARMPLPAHCEGGPACRWIEGDVDSEDGRWECTCACSPCAAERTFGPHDLDELPTSFAGLVDISHMPAKRQP